MLKMYSYIHLNFTYHLYIYDLYLNITNIGIYVLSFQINSIQILWQIRDDTTPKTVIK